MKLLKLSSTALLLCGIVAFRIIAGIEFDTKALLNNKIELKIPKGFNIMSEEMAKLKYPTEQRPTLIYTDEPGTINVALNLTSNAANQAQLTAYKDSFVEIFRNRYPSAEWKQTGVKEVNGRKVGYVEFITPAIDTKVYNLIFFTDLNGQLLLCTFNCTEKNITQWQPAAKEIMASLKLK